MKCHSLALASLAFSFVAVGCGPDPRNGDDTPGDDDPGATCPRCSPDKSAIVACDGSAQACAPDQACSDTNGVAACMNACAAAEANGSSVGCDYFAVDMDAAAGPPQDACYTVFVANTSPGQVHIDVDWGGMPIDLAVSAKLPMGSGQNITYAPYDPVAGLGPGKVAILFLAYAPGGVLLMPNVACPAGITPAIGTEAQIPANGFGKAFHIKTDLPVVAYQMLPYGGGAAAATGASLLLPSSAWGNQYVAVSAYDPLPAQQPPIQVAQGPSYNIVAKEDDTNVTILPNQAILGGGGLPAGTQFAPYTFQLDRGQYAQITQLKGLSGSPVSADKPIGMFGGHQIMSVDRCCGDHGEQMLAPVRAMGFDYVAAPHGDRKPSAGEERIYRIFGAVNETQLTYDPPGIGPPEVNAGAFLEIRTSQPFSVRSQGKEFPFSMFTYMSGAGEMGEGGWGDADFVRIVPPEQFLYHYVFFTDPTYPFTTLTVVRKKTGGGDSGAASFKDVKLSCMGGPIGGWQSVGSDGLYEMTFVKLVDHFNGMNGCNNGVQQMDSEGQFGVWVWGWGSEDTQTGWLSYGYPAGEGLLQINDVIILRQSDFTSSPVGPKATDVSPTRLVPRSKITWTLATDELGR